MPENSQEPPREKPSGSLAAFHSLSSGAWRILVSFPAVFLVTIAMGGAAFWEARTPVTIIAPFRLPKDGLPFNGDIVADAVQDALKSVRNEIDEERRNPRLESSETGLGDLKHIFIPKLQLQPPPRVTIEVKGISYERVLSFARAVMSTETTVSGDVVLQDKEFKLIARAADSGPWETDLRPINADGLRAASKELAKKILMTQDPTLAGVALFKEGEDEEALAALEQAWRLDPSDVRLKFNLCLGFAASRHYEEAINCYNDVLARDPKFPNEVLERRAHAYYLKPGTENQQQAEGLYRELAYKQGHREALLGLGEVLDDMGKHADAVKTYDEFLSAERQDRELALAHLKKSVALAKSGKHHDALEECKEALKYAPRDVVVRIQRSTELAETDGIEAGIAALRSVLNENRDSESTPFASFQLGLLLEKGDDWRGAIAQFQKAVGQQPNYVEAHQELAKALIHRGDVPAARDEFEALVKLSDSDLQRDNYKLFANLWLGDALRNARNYPAAAVAYREAILLKRDFPAAHCELGWVFAKLGHVREAIDEYGAALVPAAVKEFDDPGCTAEAPAQIVAMLARKGQERAVASAIQPYKSKRAANTNPHPAGGNTLVVALKKLGVPEQNAQLNQGEQ
jgi:tetratricopeptide (TPR) repeat protein